MSWYLIQTKSRSEEIAEKNLLNMCFSVYLPKIKLPTTKGVEIVSLYPGYLFVDMNDHSRWDKLKNCKGTVGVIKFGGIAARIHDSVIKEVLRVEKDINSRDDDYLKSGELVRIKSGSFAGSNATFEECHNNDRYFVLVDIFGRKTKISLDRRQVEKV